MFDCMVDLRKRFKLNALDISVPAWCLKKQAVKTSQHERFLNKMSLFTKTLKLPALNSHHPWLM